MANLSKIKREKMLDYLPILPLAKRSSLVISTKGRLFDVILGT